MNPHDEYPLLAFRKTCVDAGVHSLSLLAVLCHIESGDSCRKVAQSINIAYSTVWRAALSLRQQGLIEMKEVPHPGGQNHRFLLTVSDSGQQLLDSLNAMLGKPTIP